MKLTARIHAYPPLGDHVLGKWQGELLIKDGDKVVLSKWIGSGTTEVKKEYAEAIVTAVNQHEKLVEACRKLIKEYECESYAPGEASQIWYEIEQLVSTRGQVKDKSA